MSRANDTDWRAIVGLVNEDGATLCDPPEACPVCALYSGQRPGESRQAWLQRIGVTGSSTRRALRTRA